MSFTLSSGATERRPASRWPLLALIALSVAPIAASYFAYYVVKPGGAHTTGDLLAIRLLPNLPARAANGQAVDLRSLRGKWVLLSVADAQCDSRCGNNLFTLQQVRIAQGREMGRIERLLLVRDGLPQRLPDAASGVQVWHDRGGLAARLPVPLQADASRFLYVIDPLGNQVLRYRDDTEPRALIRELGKLLKNNRGLG